LFFFFYFFFLFFYYYYYYYYYNYYYYYYWASVAGAPASTAAMQTYCTSPALELPACTARSPPMPTTTGETSSRERRNCGREMPGNFSDKSRVSRYLKGSFTCRKSATCKRICDRRFYFPSEGRYAEDFFVLKNPTASTMFEPANLGTRGQHANP
jgi:hypothetical protein